MLHRDIKCVSLCNINRLNTYIMSLQIGFATQFFTLWSVGEPFKHFFNKYDFEYRTSIQYLRNLSKDEAKAIDKAVKFGATDTSVHEYLRGKSQSFTVSGSKGTDRPDWEFPDGIHRHGFGDIRKFGIAQEGEDPMTRGFVERKADKIKALWTLYLKKEILFGENSARPDWIRPCVYARRQLINLGVIVKHDGQYMTPAQVEKHDARKALEVIKNTATAGHHENDGDKVQLNLKQIDSFGFESQFGYTHIITYIDDQNRLFKYMGASAPGISTENFSTIKCTIKHAEYKEVKETKIQRARVLTK